MKYINRSVPIGIRAKTAGGTDEARLVFSPNNERKARFSPQPKRQGFQREFSMKYRSGALILVMLAMMLPHLARATCYGNGTTNVNLFPVFWGYNANSQLFFPVSENSDCTLGGSSGTSTSSFTPGGTYSTPLTVTTTSSAVALPAGTTVAVYNTGAQTAYVTLGVGAPTATTAQIAIAPGGAQGFTVGSNTYLAAITASGSTTLNIAGGSGLFTPYGGGGLTAQSTATTTDNNVSVTTSSTTVVPASSNIRMRVDISNNAVIGSGNDMWCRTDGGVATLNIGTKVYAGSGFEWLYPTVGPSAINCIMTNATVTVSYEAFQ